jgi:peptidoglycan-N-acetylglucosamine deacetylase
MGMTCTLLRKVLAVLIITSILACFPAPSSRALPVSKSGAVQSLHAKKKLKRKSLTTSQLLKKYPETIKARGPRIKSVALTFDDVPDPRYTPQLLDVLRMYHIKATFFVVGSRAQKYPILVTRMVKEGHTIGNHSYNHPQFSKLRMSAYKSQIMHTEQILQKLAGYKPKLIRPPYGDITEPQLKWAKANGYKLVNWNVDSLDWKSLSKAQVKANILSQAGKGAIILQHGGGGRESKLGGSIEALPEVITFLRQHGYTFVTVPELLHVSPRKKKSPTGVRHSFITV